MLRSTMLVITLICLAGPALATDQKLVPISKPVQIAVMEFATKGGLTSKQMEALEDMLTTEIRGLGNFKVVAKRDLDSAMKLEQRKIVMGCNSDSCVAEVIGALGIRWVVMGNVGLFGKTYLLSIKLVNAESVHIVASVSKKIKGEQDKLVEALPELVLELLAKAGLLKSAKPVENSSVGVVSAEAPAHPYSTWGHAALWSGVGLVAFGCVSAYMASAAGDEYDKNGHWGDLNSSRNWSGMMWAGFGLGAALVTTGIVLWALEPDGDQGAGLSAAPLSDGNGMMFSLGGRW